MKKYFLLFVTTIVAWNFAFSQAEKIDSVLNLYSQNYQQEKTYLQFDKSVYNKGETIWYKAYLLAGSQLSGLSKNFYVDFIDNNGKLLKHSVTPIYQASAKGQFDIPADFRGTFIHVKAYTKWMLNFDSAFIYTKDIYVFQDKPDKPLVSATPVPESIKLTFFPEGGELTEGLNSRLAYLACNQAGKPEYVSGAISTEKGVFVDSFKTQYDGMGVMKIIPKPNETYLANWSDSKGKSYTTKLPFAQKNGINLFVQPLNKKAVVLISRTDNSDENSKTLHLVAQMNQQLVYRAKLSLANKSAGVAEIPTDDLNSGILQITVFNAQLIPVAERILFVNNHNHEFITDVAVQVKNLAKKGKNVLEIFSPDSVSTNLSLSVTDAGLTTENSDIISQLLLSSEIKGVINNPVYYFSSEEDSVKQHLDLVMLTHGWRKFNWNNAFSGNLPKLPYASDSDYLQIKGKAFIPGNVKIPEGQKLSIILQSKKDSTKQILLVPLSKNGEFFLKGAVFYDSMKVFYQFLGNKKLERECELKFDNGFAHPVLHDLSANYSSPYLWTYDDHTESQKAKLMAAKQAELQKLMKTATLEEVTVTAKVKTAKEVLDEKYATGLFTMGDAYQFDISNDLRARGMTNIFQYLQGLVPGLSITMNTTSGGYSLAWRGGTPEIFLDEMKPSNISDIQSMSMSEIAYIKVFRPPFFGSATGGNGAIAIYTRKASDQVPDDLYDGSLTLKYITGYSSFKQFYSPDYSGPANFAPDLRTTVYWKPYIILDAQSRKQTIEFYNNDYSKRLRVIVEGVNAEGKLTRTEKIIE